MKKTIGICFVFLLMGVITLWFVGCDDDSEETNPDLQNFQGITMTDAAGRSIGEIDPDDWCSAENSIVFMRSIADENILNPHHRTPASYAFYPAYPNPNNGSTMLFFALPVESRVTLKLINKRGDTVRLLVDDEEIEAGYRTVQWNGQYDDGQAVPNGLYRAIIDADSFHCYGDIQVER